MKSEIKIKFSRTKIRVARAMMISLGFFLILMGGLSAQSADVFQSLHSLSQTTEMDTKTMSEPDIELLKSKASRFAVGNVELYTNARMAELSMKDRATDPFGLYQDPDKKPVIKNTTPVRSNNGNTVMKAVALSDIVKLIKVSIVMVEDKSFLVGDRLFKESEEFPITFQDRTRRIKVLEVSLSKILFKDLDSGEEATLSIGALPFGMSTGDDSIRPVGMVAPTENQPLNLEIK
jgi:hypothetical protein